MNSKTISIFYLFFGINNKSNRELKQQLDEEINLIKIRHRNEKDNFAETIRFLLTNPSSTNLETAKYMLHPKNKMRDMYNRP
jgi:hypothetical protein